MAASIPTETTHASQPLQQDLESQPEKPADTGKSTLQERAEPFLNFAVGLFIAALIALPVIFLFAVVFTMMGIMRSDGSIILADDEERPFVKGLAAFWLSIWLGAELFAKILLLIFVLGAFFVFFFG
ncbi:hypothetical protein AURDEDRAFT_130902 [Auricularia subglabra TFB-10046 SS5]|uniref:Uncharacterized protein n=1 Tax=Auricularia subglabra (strain TFB-10046 / SS5) TaxID=717982 RepID=J0WQT2_AURST|nr:hypothetical protein AURDEDRAFT_130902 [Auricularia subglabra TFB-10046 SS5]